MKIYSMTATFGKLENQTLTLQPGLNVISRPNEWGKSTWCAFLVTMLYGLDTREKTTKTTLAMKERYAPWSGSPMSGRMDLNWDGRDITIERWTKGRTPLGEFRAYETASGLAVPELNGLNCGEMLLGVERSVFQRAGFIRLSELPISQDESLRRRLNDLVTMGDDSGAADTLAQKLRDLKNKCRSNRTTGLIPQAESQRDSLQDKLRELQSIQAQHQDLNVRREQLQQQLAVLENHRTALRYAAAQQDLQKVHEAHLQAEAAAEKMAKLEEACATDISREEAVAQLQRHATLLQMRASLAQEATSLPPDPSVPQIPERYRDISGGDAIARAEQDVAKFTELENRIKKNRLVWAIYGGVCVALLIIAMIIGTGAGWFGMLAAAAVLGLAAFAFHHLRTGVLTKETQAMMARYPGIGPRQWVEDAAFYAETWQQYISAKNHNASRRAQLQARLEDTEQELTQLTEGMDSQDWLLDRNRIIANHDLLGDARRDHQTAAAHADALRAMVKPAAKPQFDDELTLPEAETARQLSETTLRLQHLQLQLGQYQGRMDALGSEQALKNQLEAVNQRIEKLNRTNSALELAQQTLQAATAELQRRFAPRIAQQAQELFSAFTAGRYDRLNLQQDLSIDAAATDEIAMHAAKWRSEGTIDQLYLALRMAVARELTADAPLILDDALVRFDDSRHGLAMEVLKKEAEQKQIILFTCQSREITP